MHVHRFVSLVRVKMKPPALHIENSGHGSQPHYIGSFGISSKPYSR
jgi:hypothetical protein